MTMKRVYLGLVFVGMLVPYGAFIPWLLDNGIEPILFVQQMFANPIAGFFSLDVLVSAVVLLAAAIHGWARGLPGRPGIVAATLLVGVSAGLPLYLYSREAES